MKRARVKTAMVVVGEAMSRRASSGDRDVLLSTRRPRACGGLGESMCHEPVADEIHSRKPRTIREGIPRNTKVRSRILSPSVARGIAVLCAAVFVASAHPAQAGINVWTSHGPPGGTSAPWPLIPSRPSTLYAGTDGAGVFKSTDAGATWSAANAGLPDTSRLRPGH